MGESSVVETPVRNMGRRGKDVDLKVLEDFFYSGRVLFRYKRWIKPYRKKRLKAFVDTVKKW